MCDTTILSSILARDGRTDRISPRLGISIRAISAVTVGEMRTGALKARWGEPRVHALDDHLGHYVILSIDRSVAEHWARLRVRCLELGRPKGENDLWIAATARRHGIPLATLDVGQQDIPGLTVIGADGTEVTIAE